MLTNGQFFMSLCFHVLVGVVVYFLGLNVGKYSIQQELKVQNANDISATVDAAVLQLVGRMERGEVALPWPEENKVLEITREVNVTRVTRVQYQCIVGDRLRWSVMENELRKTVAEEMNKKLTFKQEETRTSLNHTVTSLNRATRELREATERTTGQLREINSVAKTHGRQLEEMDERLREMDGRLALEPQNMEIRGFMKLETFGPIILVMGALEVILLLSACFLFIRVH